MALKKTITLKSNFGTDAEFDNAYIKARSVNFSKESAQVNVDFYKSNEGKRLIIKQYDFSVDLNGENPIKQAYLHLKTLPEFADAVDC
jgi:hypothetical protein